MKLLFSLCTSFLVFLALPVQAETALIAAASNVQFALDELLREFHQAHPERSLKVSFGSSGNFHSQIVHGAPYDIFFSADLSYPQKLEGAGLAAPDHKTTPYANGKIVLWAASKTGVNVHVNQFESLAHPKIKKIAVANPRHAPYGRAALESIRHFSIFEKVKNKLVLGENISQAAQFADSGAAQGAILALSLVVGGKIKNPGTYWEIPAESYQPISQGFLILKNGKNPQTAKVFANFVLGSRGQDTLKRHGYAVPARHGMPARYAVPLKEPVP